MSARDRDEAPPCPRALVFASSTAGTDAATAAAIRWALITLLLAVAALLAAALGA